MPDLFGNADPIKPAKPVVYENRTTAIDIVPAGVKTEGYDFSQIRRKFYKGQWYFAYKDVVAVLADTNRLDRYCTDLKKKMISEGFEWSEKIGVLKIAASDGKSYRTSCFSQVDILRLIEEIPSPKAEPLKQEIARLANERIEEMENPDLAVQRGYEGYVKKGYSPAFASRRAKSVIHRKALTEAWRTHGIEKPKEFAMLTDRESRGIFNRTTGEMKRDRNLPATGNLRDRMSLSEIAAQDMADTVIAALVEKHNPYGYEENGVEVDKGSAVGARLLADLQRTLEG